MQRSFYTTIKGVQYQLFIMTASSTACIYQGKPRCKAHAPISLKILKRRYMPFKQISARFTCEKRIVRALAGKGLPQFIGSGKLCGRPYYAYRYVEGDNLLLSLTGESNQPSLFGAAIVRQLLSTLSQLHDTRQAIVHGDLSPENVILSEEGPVMIDFGSAQRLGRDGLIGDGRWIGKPSYLSPEQAQGKRWDARSDLYQTGILLYELLGRRRYNTGSNAHEKRVFAAAPLRPDYTHIPAVYHPLLNALLEPEPSQRIESATEAAAMLDIAMLFDQPTVNPSSG